MYRNIKEDIEMRRACTYWPPRLKGSVTSGGASGACWGGRMVERGGLERGRRRWGRGWMVERRDCEEEGEGGEGAKASSVMSRRPLAASTCLCYLIIAALLFDYCVVVVLLFLVLLCCCLCFVLLLAASTFDLTEASCHTMSSPRQKQIHVIS